VAFLRWADNQGYQEIRHATKKISHDGKPLMTSDLRNFAWNAAAMYGDSKKRDSYDPTAMSICNHIG
jgi:hypothetical protein